jgi:hypothetical protein
VVDMQPHDPDWPVAIGSRRRSGRLKDGLTQTTSGIPT